jgi:hypothetical protein
MSELALLLNVLIANPDRNRIASPARRERARSRGLVIQQE